jgi:hypothetical protein
MGQKEKEMKVTLKSGDNQIITTCKGVSQHIYNRYVVHGLSKAGRKWLADLPGGAACTVYTKQGAERLDYLTDAPVP